MDQRCHLFIPCALLCTHVITILPWSQSLHRHYSGLTNYSNLWKYEWKIEDIFSLSRQSAAMIFMCRDTLWSCFFFLHPHITLLCVIPYSSKTPPGNASIMTDSLFICYQDFPLDSSAPETRRVMGYVRNLQQTESIGGICYAKSFISISHTDWPWFQFLGFCDQFICLQATSKHIPNPQSWGLIITGIPLWMKNPKNVWC